MMELKQVQRLLKERARAIGSQKRLALQLGVSQQYLSDVIHGRRMPNAKILRAMGLELVPCYRHVYHPAPLDAYIADENI